MAYGSLDFWLDVSWMLGTETNPASGSKGPSRRAFLSASAATAITAPIVMRAGSASAATVTPHPAHNTGNFDPNLRALIRQIDPNRIQATIEKLTTFGTRHTASTRWNANPETNVTGYEVVMRETTTPDWTSAIPVGNVTSVTLNISKDDVQFGVRAVDQNWNRSPVGFPQAVA